MKNRNQTSSHKVKQLTVVGMQKEAVLALCTSSIMPKLILTRTAFTVYKHISNKH